MTVLSIDLETYSSVDLPKAGLHAYVASPDFEILLFAYAWNDQPVQVVDLAQGEWIPSQVLSDLTDPFVLKTAWNAQFERTALERYLIQPMRPEEWRCSMIHSYYLGLPGGLGLAAKAVGVEAQKDTAGAALIRYFSKPCKPTKANGGRTRNLPQHDPERWAQYKEYCRQDVETERAVRLKLESMPVPEKEQQLWELDQRINDFGVAVDQEMVAQAVACDHVYSQRLVAEAAQVTGLDNPNSVAQLKRWVEEREGEELESLDKDAVKDLLKRTDDEAVRQALSLRQEMAKASVAKYQAIQKAVCPDGRVRGLLQFYGANRTGRWAGRLVQVQNLPRNTLVDLDVARGLLRDGFYDALELLYDAVPDVLSQLIRTAFVPSEGCRFLVADFSAIEARVIAWLAGEQWRLDVFTSHGKIYEASASQMFGVPVESIDKHSPLRQKGKIAELACIAEGQLVLTDRGLVPIETVTLGHRVWDGQEFVSHDGVLFRGSREVVAYDGLTATADHPVWVEGEPEPVQFGYAAASGARLVRSGDGRQAVRVGEDHLSREAVECRLEGSHGTDPVHGMRRDTVDPLLQPGTGQVQGLPNLLSTKTHTEVAESTTDGSKTTVLESPRPGLWKLRRPRYSVQLPLSVRSGFVDHREPGAPLSGLGTRQDQQRRALRARKPPVCAQEDEPGQPTADSTPNMEPPRVALCPFRGYQEAVSGDDPGADHRGSQTGCPGQAEELAGHCEKARVYDILNAGPRNRFTVSGRLVHNCGYQGGPGALINMGALEMGLTEDQLPDIISAWRAANPRIVQLWHDVSRAALEAVQHRTTVRLQHGLSFIYGSGMLRIQLPSGRHLCYVRPKIELDPNFNRPGLTFEAQNQGRWVRERTYGGKLVENITQAVARDCLAESMLRVDAAGYPIVFHVHDEAVADVPNGVGSVEEMTGIMGQPIAWAPGLPLRADGYECDYYRKD